MSMTISANDAAELYELSDGDRHGEWTRIAVQRRSTGRWRENYWLVVTKSEGFYGIPYAEGLTENQDSDYPWEDSEAPIAMTPLVPVEVTTTEYRKAAS